MAGRNKSATRGTKTGAREYQLSLARCQAAWQATGDPAFISEAQALTHRHRRPPALWLSQAIIELAARCRTKHHATSRQNDLVRYLRFVEVRAAKGRGLSWIASYAEASEGLEGRPAAGKDSTMEKAYKDVSRDWKNGRDARYNYPNTPDAAERFARLVPPRKIR